MNTKTTALYSFFSDTRHLTPVAWIRRNLATILTLAAFASAIGTYIAITGNDAPLGMKPKRVLTLLLINISLLALLSGIIGRRVWRLWKSLRVGASGSRLQKRILVLFSIVTITPTLIVSVFSALFFNLGIQTWFNERVQTAVQESLAVAQAYLAEHAENIRGDALAMASDLNQLSSLALRDPEEFRHVVATQSALRELTETIVFKGRDNQIVAQSALSFALTFERMPPDAMERARRGEVVLMTAEHDKVRALLKLDSLSDTYLLVGRLVDRKVLDHMASAQGAVSEYNNLKSQLNRLQFTFSIVFVLLALLLLLAAVWYGMIFAARLTTPISNLALAAERVRGGDFSARVDDASYKDEIGMLSRSFNRMTEQLAAQRTDLIEANRRLDERRRFSEAVLSGVSAGVIALDRNKNITLPNRSAIAILSKIDQPIAAETSIEEVLPGIGELLSQAEHLPGEVAQDTLTLNKNGKTISLHVRVTVEQFDAEIEGFIVTFDDITLLIAAQRNAAWADVARRIAHEIKNPLTPIQLSAERLKRKYLKFITEDQDSFIKYTDTIAKHVGDIGKMVEEFVSFARMPQPKFASEDITGIIRKAAFSGQVANPGISYALDVPETPVMFYCDERQITQILTNVLKNAAEAIEGRLSSLSHRERAGGEGPHNIKSSPHPNPLPEGEGIIKVTLACPGDRLEITVEDNGIGLPAVEPQQLLEPYVTTRTKGTGLGLAIARKIVEDHKGRISLENIPGGGARVVLSFLQHCDINAAT